MASTHILAVGKIEHGELEMALPGVGVIMTKHAYVEYLCSLVEEPPTGELQRMIDYADEAADYEDYMADVDFWRTGC